jgi:hypothetical protein
MPNRICLTNCRRLCGKVALFGILTWVNGAAAETPTPDSAVAATNDADTLFSEAVTQFKQGAHAKALGLFSRVAQLKDSPNVELYLGYCHTELGNDHAAHQAFSLAVRQALENADPKYAAARRAAQDQLAVLELRLAKLTISLVEDSKTASVTLDDKRLSPSELGSTIVVNPGVHYIVAESTGKKRLHREVELEKGSSKTITLLFEQADVSAIPTSPPPTPAPETARESRSQPFTTYGFAAAGLGLAGFGVLAVAGYQTKSTFDRLRRECGAGCSDASHRDLIDSGKTYQTVANVGLATGIIGTLASAALLYLGYSREERPRPGLEVGAGTALLSCQGRF